MDEELEYRMAELTKALNALNETITKVNQPPVMKTPDKETLRKIVEEAAKSRPIIQHVESTSEADLIAAFMKAVNEAKANGHPYMTIATKSASTIAKAFYRGTPAK